MKVPCRLTETRALFRVFRSARTLGKTHAHTDAGNGSRRKLFLRFNIDVTWELFIGGLMWTGGWCCRFQCNIVWCKSNRRTSIGQHPTRNRIVFLSLKPFLLVCWCWQQVSLLERFKQGKLLCCDINWDAQLKLHGNDLISVIVMTSEKASTKALMNY